MILLPLFVLASACGTQTTSVPPAATQQVPGAVPTQLSISSQTPGLLSGTTIAVPNTGIATADPGQTKQSACPRLESALYQLTRASQPIDQAKQQGLAVKGDKVQVLIVLSGEDTAFLHDFGVEVGSRSGTSLQAFVPIDRLCELANTEPVIAIRRSATAMP